jgi:membrane-associated phospholipid phosphatase
MVLILGFLVAVCALWFFAWLAEEMLEGATAQFDSQVRSAIHAHSSDQLTAIMKLLTFFGSSLLMAPLAILILAICYIRREFHVLEILAATFAGAVVLELLLKVIFQRPRPVPFFDLPQPATYSFPSGHALFSFCFFAGLAVVVSPRLAHPAARIALWFFAFALIFGIGFSRVYLGVHYPSDVLAGYAAGIVWVATLQLAVDLHRRHVERERPA